mgnify:CR=1 FL=1
MDTPAFGRDRKLCDEALGHALLAVLDPHGSSSTAALPPSGSLDRDGHDPCERCHRPLNADADPLAASVGLCSLCEIKQTAARAAEREATTLAVMIYDDALAGVLLHACAGRGGHRQCCRMAAVSRRLNSLVSTQLWRLLCMSEHGASLTERIRATTAPLMLPGQVSASRDHEGWSHLHRVLSVPVRFRNRPYRSWRQRLVRPAVIRLDAGAVPRLEPGFGFARWNTADHLLSPTGLALFSGTDGSGGVSSSALLCVLRESSSEHILLSGVRPSMSPAAIEDLKERPLAVAPTHGGVSEREHDLLRAAKGKGPPLQRCLCCARSLRPLGRDSGAICERQTPSNRRDLSAHESSPRTLPPVPSLPPMPSLPHILPPMTSLPHTLPPMPSLPHTLHPVPSLP